MSMFGQIKEKLRRRGGSVGGERVTLNFAKGNYMEKSRGAKLGAGGFKRGEDIELLWDEEAFEDDMVGDVISVRLNRIEVTVGQRWVLRVKFEYRIVLSTGETIVQEVAAPREEVKATKYINGKLSSKTCHLDLDEGEFLVAVSGCVHTSEGLFTDLSFTTSSRKKADFRSACSSGSSDRFRKWTTGDLLAVDVWKFDASRRRAEKDRETKGDVGVIGLRIAYVQTWGNMSGLGRIGAIVNRFVPVKEGAVEEWSEEMVLEKRRLNELEAADREEMLARNRSNKVKKGDYWRQNNVLADETVMEGRDGFALGRGAGHLSYNELHRQQEKANVTRSNNRVEFEMFMEEYRSNSAQIDGLEAAKNFMELSPEKVRPKVSLEETGGLSFYDGEINQYGTGWGEEDVEGGEGEGNGKNGDNFDGEGDEIDEAVRQKIVQSSRALLRYALSNI